MDSGTQVVSLHLSIAGFPVRIRIVGSAWGAAVKRALGHLSGSLTDGYAALDGLTIDVWDSHESGVRVPGFDHSPDAPPTLLKASTDRSCVGLYRPHGVMWLDEAAGYLVGFTRGVHQLTLDERARPFHKLLSHWLGNRGVQFLHAGLMCAGDTGVLLVGSGGAGKSTTSTACLMAGMEYLGDDFVGLSEKAGEFVGHGFYATCLLDRTQLQNFPRLAPHAYAPNYDFEDKQLVYLDCFSSQLLRRTTRIRALILPKIVGGLGSSVERATRIDGLMALAPTSVMYLPKPSLDAFNRVAALAEAVPSFRLNLGTDLKNVAYCVRSVLNQLNEDQNQYSK